MSDDGRTWYPARKTFLFPTKALGKLVRSRFREAFAKRCPGVKTPAGTWRQPWVVHITPWNEGAKALEYFARYAFRIAITDCRIIAVDGDKVTFRHKDREADCHRTLTVDGIEFVRRYLQHALPQGFHKLRYYGLWHPAKRTRLDNLRRVLLLEQPNAPPRPGDDAELIPDGDHTEPVAPLPPRTCPHCRRGHLVRRERIPKAWPCAP